MNREYPKKKRRVEFALLLAIYVVLGLLFLKFYSYQLDPDGISYISIAQKYARGDFRHAINGYWGPLISWLLVPFLVLGLPPLVSTKLLSLCIGLFTIIGLRRLSYRFDMSENIRRLVVLSVALIVLQFAMWIFTPDLLITCVLLYYFDIIFRADYGRSISKGALCGAIGAVAYLAKSYALPFFLSHFLLLNVLHHLAGRTDEKRKNVFRGFIPGIVVFCILAAPWIYIISNKYDNLTVGNSGRYSWEVVGPESQGQAMFWVGFIPPPNETAISGWEDPCYIKMIPWSPFESWNYFVYELRHILRNVRAVAGACVSFSPLSVAIVLGYILICAMPISKLILRSHALFPLLTILLYAAGYTFFLVHTRYLWVVCILLLPMGGHLLHRLFQSDFFDAARRKMAMILFVLSFIAMPLAQLVRDMNVGRDIYRLSQRLEEMCKLRGRIASNNNWRESFYLAYHLNLHYYGVPRPGTEEGELKRQLKKHGIDYFFAWGEDLEGLPFLSDYEEVTGGRVSGLRIYNLADRASACLTGGQAFKRESLRRGAKEVRASL